MTPPLLEKKRVMLLTVCALATGVAPAACGSDDSFTGFAIQPTDASGLVDTGYDDSLREGGNVFPSYDAYVPDSDVDDADADDAADADISDADDAG